MILLWIAMNASMSVWTAWADTFAGKALNITFLQCVYGISCRVVLQNSWEQLVEASTNGTYKLYSQACLQF